MNDAEKVPIRCEWCKENPVTHSWQVQGGVKRYLCLKCWNEFCDKFGFKYLKDRDPDSEGEATV